MALQGLIVLLPPPLASPDAIRAFSQAGISLLQEGAQGAPLRWLLPDSPLMGSREHQVLSAEHALLDDAALQRRCQEASALEVTRLKEIERARRFGLSTVVVKGAESSGLVGDCSTASLLEAALGAGLRVICRGGVSPQTARAFLEMGASGVMIDAALLLAPELSLPLPLRERLSRLSLEDLRRIEVAEGLWLSVYGGVSNQSALRLAKAPKEERLSLAGASIEAYRTGDIASSPWLVGQDALLARPLAARYQDLSSMLSAFVEAPRSGPLRPAPQTPKEPKRAKVITRPEEVLPTLQAGETRLTFAAHPQGPLYSSVLFPLCVEAALHAFALGLPVQEVSLEGGDSGAFARLLCTPLANANIPLSGTPVVGAPTPNHDESMSAPKAPPLKEPMSNINDPSREPIAIIGIGARLPGGNSLQEFWRFVLSRGDAITRVPKDRWDPTLYFDKDPKAPDKTYTDIGGWVTGFTFDRKAYRIPPSVVTHIDPAQQLALAATEEALRDAGLLEKDWDRSRCAVVLGNSMGGELVDIHTRRLTFPEVAQALKMVEGFARLPEGTRREILDRFETQYKAHLPEITEDSMPGELSNVIPGRIANVFDLGGPNFTCDAACASSAAALDTAARGLRARDFDVAVSGGVDKQMGPGTFIKFCKIGALSPENSFPFDARASGFVMGEGTAIFVLKRLSDALRDNDKIYALFLGAGGSSDGRGKGITAPNPQGQLRAIRRALENTQVSPESIGLIEAHGTATKVGDSVEVHCLAEVFQGVKTQIALGSVKSQIGHLKSAAAAAATLKTVMALHTKTLPPQIRFEQPSPVLELEKTPFRVQTKTEPWESKHPRRAGVSSFGFGGVNFHLLFEEYIPGESGRRRAEGGSGITQTTTSAPKASAEAPTAQSRATNNPGVLLFGADNKPSLISRLKAALANVGDAGDGPKGASANVRFALSIESEKERQELLAKAIELLEANKPLSLLETKGAFLREGPKAGKLAFLFPGQGSQHLWMAEGLKNKYPQFAALWTQADRLSKEFMARELSSWVYVAKELSEAAQAEAFKALSATAVAQPAIFTTDLAYWRLLQSFGVSPDMVLGHSLGEYAAAVAAGVGTFEVGFRAVCTRGKAMGSLQVKDPGKMAGINAPYQVIQEVLRDVKGYIVAANKNCPSQTVIAGETNAVEEALQRFSARGVSGVVLPVSHAFHSQIVAPASAPLREVLDSLPLEVPERPIVSNVTGDFYPTGPSKDQALNQIRELLSRQVASPVEFTACVEKMYQEGARIFIEVGPKRALSSFVSSILGEKQHRVYSTNDPKRGDLSSFQRALAALAAEGFAGAAGEPTEITASETPIKNETTMTTYTNNSQSPKKEETQRSPFENLPVVSGIAIGLPGGAQVFSDDNFDKILAGENRISAVPEVLRQKIVEKRIVRVVKDAAKGGGDFQPVSSTEEVIKLAGRAGVLDIAKQYGIESQFVEALDRTSQLALGAGIEALKDAGIPLVRVFKTTTKGAKIGAGWRLPESLADETGIIFASAFPGYNQLIEQLNQHAEAKQRRALIASYQELEATLHEPQAKALIAQKRRVLEEAPIPTFDRRFLFEVLSMGHSQFAQWLGARGPNTQVNAACASTTQAIAMAEDWIRLNRCKRVLVVGADDVTSDTFFEWVGAGFLAAGAATTESEVTRAALPFDKRRHGMIIGMGAVALVVEEQRNVFARGMLPMAEIVATRIANSAFHGSRLDPEHIAREVERLVDTAEERIHVPRKEIAKKCVFMSHETYTPARGGSAAAEIAALRRAFGEEASSVVIANTKGFTGHPMGAGIEDAVVLKALQRQTIPPIANLQEPDPELGNLSLSKGGHYPVQYALRLAAGFGSQLALTLYRRTAGEERLSDAARYSQWLTDISGIEKPATRVIDGILRVVEDSTEKAAPVAPEAKPALAPTPAAPAITIQRKDIQEKLFGIVSEKTGYGVSELEEGFSLEADLGIDTVKQAEIISSVRDAYGLARDDSFRLADYPTLKALIDYLYGRLSSSAAAKPAPVVVEAKPAPIEAPKHVNGKAQPLIERSSVQERLFGIVSEKTGYGVSELEEGFSLEADLGIDTVKQAEIISSVRDAYSLARDDSFRLADYPTLKALIDYLYGRLLVSSGKPVESRVVAPAPTPAPPRETKPAAVEPPAKPAIERSSVQEKLFGIVSEKTGYGVSELEEGFSLEADLGIDTVKQAEIISSVRDAYGLARDDSFRLADYPTLKALIDYLYGRLSAGGVKPSAPAAPRQSEAPKQVEAGLARPFVSRKVALSALPAVNPGNRRGRILLIQSGNEHDYSEAFYLDGFSPVVISFAKEKALNEEALSAQIESELVNARGSIGVVNLLGLPTSHQANWASEAHWRARAFFHVARILAKIFGGQPPQGYQLMTVVNLGGGLGVESPSGALPVAMAQVGLTKSLSKEWAGVQAKILDVGAQSVSSVISKEFSAQNDPIAVGYFRGQRVTTTLQEESLPTIASTSLQSQAVIVTGGARGVTAEVAKELAKQGAKIALFGLTPLPPEVEQNFASIDVNQQREALKTKLQSQGARVTPAALDAAVAPLKKQIEIARNLAALKQYSEAIYLAVDTSDAASVEHAVEESRRRLGPIVGAIHGAGIEESRLLAQKDGAAFDRIFIGKASGAVSLWSAIKQDNPRFFLGMGSVAGYFGNPGQPDYCAANASLSGLCTYIASTTQTRALCIDWTAWDEVGMAVRGGMKRLLQDRGVDLLPPSQGASFALYAIHAGLSGERVIAGRLGDFEQAAAPAQASIRSETVSSVQPRASLPPLVDQILSEEPGQRILAMRRLRPEQDKFLSDHAFEGVPLLPGVMGVEMMSQVASLLQPETVVVEVREVEFLRPVKAHPGKDVEVLLSAERLASGEIQAKLLSRREGVNGKILESEHFTAKFRFGTPTKALPQPGLDLGAPLQQGPGRDEVYRRFFHGPSFQVVEQVSALGRKGAAASYAAPEIGVPDLFTMPLLRELAFQTAGLHAMACEGQVALPAGIGCVKRYAPTPTGAKLIARVAYLGKDARGHLCYHAEVRGPDGALLDAMEDLRLVPARPLEEGLRLSILDEPPMEVVVVNIGPVANALLSSPELLVESWLSPKERVRLSSLALEKRRIEWMSGRIAAKRLMRGYLMRRFALEVSPTLLEIECDNNGAPHCRVASQVLEGAQELPEISITHSGEIAAAAFVYGARPGIDVEKIEVRDKSFRDHCFTDIEARLAQGEDEPANLTRLFSVKEAVSKSLGVGFALDPREIEVVGLRQDGRAEVALHGRAKEEFAKLGGKRLEASVETRGAYAYAWARLFTTQSNA